MKTTHGLHNTKTYHAWENMIARCTNTKWPKWADYGGRGIAVCQKWRTFEGFFADMGEAPSDKSLDRLDNNGNYEPGNCRWATKLEQEQNKRANRNSSTGLRGIHVTKYGTYCVQGMYAGKRVGLYQGPDLFEAVCSRRSWELKRSTV